MTSEEFVKLYKKSELDELITPFKDGVGFSLVRKYKQNSEYSKDDKRIFIKLYLSSNNIVNGGIEMVDPDEKKTGSYRIVTESKYKKRITSFGFGEEEEIVFNEKEKKIFYEPKKLFLTLNDFVEVIVYNHLSNRVFWRRKLNYLIDIFLRVLFWLSDKHYERINVMLEIHRPTQRDEHDKNDEKNIEPFFKYFFITKNILFSLLLVIFPTSVLIAIYFKNFSIFSQPTILFFFLVLFAMEKVSISLDKKIKAFFSKKEKNFIYRLHNYQFIESFKMKFKKCK